MAGATGGGPERVLLESPKVVADLFRSAAHPARIRILALLRQGERDLSSLVRQTRSSKNALVNHLGHLRRMGVVERAARGKYRLTADGEALVDAVAEVYEASVRRDVEKRERVLRLYEKRPAGGGSLSKKLIDKKVEYLPCWLSYTGAMAGSLRALGVECDPVDVGGQSGYAFLVNVLKDRLCLSGPTAIGDETWDAIHRAVEGLGWKLEHWYENISYPEEPGKPTPAEVEHARVLFEKVKGDIDAHGRPVVLWGLAEPEYGIVRGYEGDAYLVSTFRTLNDPDHPEAPIRFLDLKAPGCLDAIFFREKAERDPARTDREALKRAIDFASGSAPVPHGYVAGPAALGAWADTLERPPVSEVDYMGNSYLGCCVQEGRAMSAEYLRRLAKRHPGKAAKSLLEAADCYAKGAAALGEFTKLFPFPQGEWTPETRRRGAQLLRKVRPLEEQAIVHLRQALKNWKAS